MWEEGKRAEELPQIIPFPGQSIKVDFKIHNKLPEQVFCQMWVENNYKIDFVF